jgi:hypothetical protein
MIRASRMGGRKSRSKGIRNELMVAHQLQEAGFAATRVPLSGGAGGKFSGDVTFPLFGLDRKLEVKSRATGFSQIYTWLADNYGLIIRRDRDTPLLVIRLADAIAVAKVAEKAKGVQP